MKKINQKQKLKRAEQRAYFLEEDFRIILDKLTELRAKITSTVASGYFRLNDDYLDLSYDGDPEPHSLDDCAKKLLIELIVDITKIKMNHGDEE